MLASVLVVTLSEKLIGRQTDLPVLPTNRSQAKAALIPYPRDMKWPDQYLALTSVFISMPGNGGKKLRFIARTLRQVLSEAAVKIIEKGRADAGCGIRLGSAPVDNPRNSKEACRLKVAEKGVEL